MLCLNVIHDRCFLWLLTPKFKTTTETNIVTVVVDYHLIEVRRIAAKLLSHFSRVRLCVTPDGSPRDSPFPGILQARTLEWVAISFSNAWKWKVKLLRCVQLLATPWTAAYQAPPSMGFPRQEYWSGVPLPSPGGLLWNISSLKKAWKPF